VFWTLFFGRAVIEAVNWSRLSDAGGASGRDHGSKLFLVATYKAYGAKAARIAYGLILPSLLGCGGCTRPRGAWRRPRPKSWRIPRRPGRSRKR